MVIGCETGELAVSPEEESPESRVIADIAVIGKAKGLPLINTDDTDQESGDLVIAVIG